MRAVFVVKVRVTERQSHLPSQFSRTLLEPIFVTNRSPPRAPVSWVHRYVAFRFGGRRECPSDDHAAGHIGRAELHCVDDVSKTEVDRDEISLDRRDATLEAIQLREVD